MSYQFRGKNTTDLPFSTNESHAHMQRIKELDRRFIAEQERREFMEPLTPRRIADPAASLKWGVCGENSGYQAHIVNKTEPCGPCREAHAIYHREYRRTRRLIAA
jgi:hypothetical protein